MLQPVVTVDNGGPALVFELVGRKISPKAGIIKSLISPNSTITSRTVAVVTLSQIFIYSNTIYTEITTHALALRLVSSSIPITTGNIIILHNGSTMTGGSR